MPADVLSEATRHAERLVELASGNPASHELRSYVHMHNAEQDLDVACGYALPSDCQKRKDYAFWCHFNEKPSIIPGCPDPVIVILAQRHCSATLSHMTICRTRLLQGPTMWLKHALHNLHATNVETLPHNKGCAKPKGDSDSTNGTFPQVDEGLLTKP